MMKPNCLYPLFWNVHCNQEHDEHTLFEQLRAWQPRAILTMGNAGYSQRVKREFPTMHVIHREPPDDRLRDMDAESPERWVNMVAEKLRDTSIVIQIGNELPQMPETFKWLTRAARECGRLGQSYCVGAWGTGGPGDETLLTSEWVTLHTTLLETGGRYAFHEYFPGHNPHLHAFRAEGGPTRLVHYDPVYDLLTGRSRAWETPDLRRYANFHIGRSFRVAWIIENLLGLPPIDWYVLEYGADDAWYSDYKGPWSDRYNPGGPALSDDQYAAYLVDNVWSVYAPDPVVDPHNPYLPYARHFLGAMVFSYGNSGRANPGGQGNWYRFNVEGHTRLFALIDQDVTRWRQRFQEDGRQNMEANGTLLVQANVGLNVREQPAVEGRLLGRLGLGQYRVEGLGLTRSGGYVWLHFASAQYPDGAYVALRPETVTDPTSEDAYAIWNRQEPGPQSDPEPEPDPISEPEPEPTIDVERRIAALEARLDMLEKRYPIELPDGWLHEAIVREMMAGTLRQIATMLPEIADAVRDETLE